jgi:hypothetical protein
MINVDVETIDSAWTEPHRKVVGIPSEDGKLRTAFGKTVEDMGFIDFREIRTQRIRQYHPSDSAKPAFETII